MRESSEAPPQNLELHSFLKRALLGLEWGSLAALMLIALVQPTTGRAGLPTWALVLLFAAYLLLVDLIRNKVPRLRAFKLKYVLGLPVGALIYFLGAEPGGPLFVLFFLSVVCAAATLTLRESLVYTAAAAVLTASIAPTFPGWSPAGGDLRELGVRLVLLALFGASTAILTRRLALERETARSAHGQRERLEELDRLRALFLSSVSHGLRTPLTAAQAGLGLFETSVARRLRPDERDLLDNVRRNTARVGLIIDDLLAYNQLEAGTLRLDREALDLRAVVTGAMSTVHHLIHEKGQVLEVDLPEPLPSEGDSRHLEQVVVDLLHNAHVHTPSGTRIGISGRLVGTEVSLSVSDDGPGIPEEELETVFRRFYRLGPAEGGSGLGLAIAKGIVEFHDGRIWAESPSGCGTTLRVVLRRKENGETS